MTLAPALMLQIASYLITIGIFVGVSKQLFANLRERLEAQNTQISLQIRNIETQIHNLEKKVEKHNSVVERTFRCEESIKSAHHRLDDLKGEIRNGER